MHAPLTDPTLSDRGRVAVVTGASRGIGAGIARTLRDSGFRVAGVSIQNAAPEANRWYRCDVSVPEEVERTAANIVADLGAIDVLVNCAGVAESAELTATSIDLWNHVLGVNLTGPFLWMRATMPLMEQKGWGRIINLASIASKRGEPQMAAYSSSKHALLGLTRSAALQNPRSGVTINAICPGPVPTDLLEHGLREWANRSNRSVEVGKRIFQSSNPQNRFFDIDEVSALVAYLVSDAARGINGQAINLCGGTVLA